MFSRLKSSTPGIVFCVLVAMAASLISAPFPMLGTAATAIILGAAISNLSSLPDALHIGIKTSEKKGLELAVVLLGLQLPLQDLLNHGQAVLGTLLISLTSVALIAWLIARAQPRHSGLAFFLGIGTAICGSSAIAAATPLKPNQREAAALSIGLINLLGVAGLLLLPILAQSLSYDAVKTAALIGGSLQAVGHVAAAALPLGDEVGQLAIPIKMSRVAMLVPTLFFIGLVQSKKKSNSPTKIRLPWYLFGFLITAVLGSFDLLSEAVFSHIKWLTSTLINIAMVAIGLSLQLRRIYAQIGTAAFIGSGIWMAQIIALCLFLSLA